MPEEPQDATVYLDRVFERLKIDINSPEYALFLQWPAIVTEFTATHCRCAGCRNGILYVVCDNHSQAELTRLNGREIMKRVNSAFPELDIKKINIRVKT